MYGLFFLASLARYAHPMVDARHSDLFQSQPSSDISMSLSTSANFAIVNSCATLYHSSSSQLASIQDIPIPPVQLSNSLIKLHPRLEAVLLLQAAQSTEIGNLRSRSAALMARWQQLAVVGGGKCWVEWDRRIRTLERDMRRLETSGDDEGEAL